MSSDFTAVLLGAGFDPDAARSRSGLVETAWQQHLGAAGVPPWWGWHVPGRIEIFGKHTDYAGGRSLLAAAPRGFAVVASPRDDDVVSVRDARTGEAQQMTAEDDRTTFSGWFRYVAVIVRRLRHNFPGASLGADVTFASDLPRAAGLSSSSALTVSVSTALIRRAALTARPEWGAAIRDSTDLAGYLGALETGLSFGALAGTSGIGVHGGSEDHTAILTCQPGVVSAYRYVPIRPIGVAPMPEEWRFVIASSGVEAAKAGSARAQYNRASLATRALVGLWNAHQGSAWATLADVLGSAADAAADLDRLAGSATGSSEFDAETLTRRLAHFIAEDARIMGALEAFRERDRTRLGALSAASQHDAERLLGNQTEETSTLARLGTDSGAFASASFGAGFGGSVWALVPTADAQAFGERWSAAYRTRFPRLAMAWFVASPGPGLCELPVR